MFFEEFFEKRGENIEPNIKGEVLVHCPFEHDKGYDTRPSASFNTDKRIYKCFTCSTEGRENGMSETSFIAKIYNTSYDNAVKLKAMCDVSGEVSLDQATQNLLETPSYMEYLEARGITKDVILEYNLGFNGAGIVYPVILNGMVVDERVYNPFPEGDEPKIKSKRDAKALLFPYDHWIKDDRPTLLCAGENDTLLARKMNFNAVETTMGEGSIPKILINKFRGKKVYICYDCDEAGKKAAKRFAFYIKEAGAEVYIVDLGLPGTKDDKDITDFFIKHGKTAEELQRLLDNSLLFTEADFLEEKNKEYKLVELWNVRDPKYSDQYISSRVMQMGHFDLPQVDVPSFVEWECKGDKDCSTCKECFKKNKKGHWSLESENLEDVIDLLEVNQASKDKHIRKLCKLPDKCPNTKYYIVAKKYVEKVVLSPDVESESESTGYRAVDLLAYVISGNTEDGNKYRMFFKRIPHPKDGSIILIVDRVEDSDNAINMFKVTDKFKEDMKKWQGNPFVVMNKRYEELGKKAVGKYLPKMIYYASELTYHSVLDMKFAGQDIKGHPEILIVGASRTGKSQVGKVMSNFYGLGNVTECKSASIAGLIGGVDKLSNGTYRIAWGEIPRNHKGLLFLDEVSGLPSDVFKKLTGMRSERVATIAKIRKGQAPAKTRLMWVGNPRTKEDGLSRSLYDYSNGVEVCLDLFPADEDIARFDAIILVPEPEEYISPLNSDGTVPEKAQLPIELKQLIRWVWSRKPDQVQFETHVEQYIEHKAKLLNKDFGSSVKIIGIEGDKKIARIATSVAACCFSCSEDGETIIVKKEHVDWTEKFLLSCYDNEIFRLRDFVAQERLFNTTNDQVNLIVAKLIKTNMFLVKVLIQQTEVPTFNLQAISGLDRLEYNRIINEMYASGLVKPTTKGVSATRRLKLAVDAYRKNGSNYTIMPVSHEGGIIL